LNLPPTERTAERSAERTTELQKQKLDELSGAVLRALTADPQLHYRSTRLYKADERLAAPAPHLQLALDAPEQALLATRRALVDAHSLNQRYSDKELHQGHRPTSSIERLIFDWLEQLRVETLTHASMPGQRSNLLKRFESWSMQFQHSGELETVIGLLIFTVSQVCWSRLTGLPLDDDASDRIEGVRARMVPVLGGALAALKKLSHDQLAFAPPALEIASWVAEQCHAEIARQSEAREAVKEEIEAKLRASFAILLDLDQDEEQEALRVTPSGTSKVFEANAQKYRVYSKAFDGEIFASDLLRPEQLKEYRLKLDGLVEAQGINLQRLAKQLQRLLARPQREGWDFGQDEGVIDGRRLSQVLSSPSERRLFKTERFPPRSACLFSVLIDCSGSMKAHMETVAVLADLLARALDMAGISNEVLGFTTGAWNGGRARKAWLKAGQPSSPGRLNEVNHLIFKPSDRRWRHARGPMGALFKPDIFREGIDGEAVEWACQRMLSQDHERRILLVISDGCPMDTSTHQANDNFYLDNHLQQVIGMQEKNKIEILGLGVGLDLSVYYNRCVGIDADRKVDSALLDEILSTIAGRHRHRQQNSLKRPT
jgi:cobaltochelatase CobT